MFFYLFNATANNKFQMIFEYFVAMYGDEFLMCKFCHIHINMQRR